MCTYNIVAATSESTVVAEYIPETSRSEAYQSESDLEREFIRLLTTQGYEYVKIRNNDALVANLRRQLELLNNYTFSDTEWRTFYDTCISSRNESIVDKTRKIQTDPVQNLRRDNGSTKNITLIDKNNIHNNRLQVINQFEELEGTHATRYDVTILVNGLPLVHVEIKRRGVQLKEAFNQITRYQRDSFWAGSSLFEYVQIFVISNGTHTKYYSNTTRSSHMREQGSEAERRKSKNTSNSFEFTSYWADGKNKTIADLVDFTKTFMSKHTLLNVLTKYCVFTSENQLLVMRPYQIVATEQILSRIKIAQNYKRAGSVEAGGYIWHTTGSGKTLTSFKTAQIASKLPGIDKVIFVVDRKDLDYQTMKEYERFEKGAANGNRSTKVLQRQLENLDSAGSPHDYKVIVTTIQKLDCFITRNPQHPIYQKHIILIFDECHRSQFGEMHRKIEKSFKKYYLFGFTGTPIFAVNSVSSGNPHLRTTEDAFGDQLHSYTIVDAIHDENVLPFHIDFVDTIRRKDGEKDRDVEAINTESALLAPARISEVVGYVLEHFDQKTMRSADAYTMHRLVNVEMVAKYQNRSEERVAVRVTGFNSIFAVSSIDAAKLYYREFLRQLSARPEQKLNVATIFSFGQNEEEPEGFIDDENSDSTEDLDVTSRDYLENAIRDYNAQFGTAYDTSSDKFPNYYKDLSLRMKNREIDILIVVNMFLTGFDATTLNTLWVDKNLRQHGLIQAFSRTNRILNSVKKFGNIVCFRNLQEETDKAIALFGDKEAAGIVRLKSYQDYYSGYTDEKGKRQKGYEERIAELIQKYPLREEILGEKAEKDFIALFGSILRLRNILSCFDEFTGNEILVPIDFQDYTGIYNDLYDKYRNRPEKENIQDDIVFEMELVRQIEVNIDYILMLVAKFHQTNCEDKSILVAIDKAIKSSFALRSKKELIEDFLQTINAGSDISKDWAVFVLAQKESDLAQIIKDESLSAEEVKSYIDHAFRDGAPRITGTSIDRILPPMSRFGGGNREAKKQAVIAKLLNYFEKYSGLV